jgi:hypothetical protein
MAAGWSAGQPLLNRRVLFIEATRMAVFAGVAGVIISGSLATLRAYQATRVREILRGYASAPLVPLKTAATARGDRTVHLPGLWTPRDALDPVATRYIVAEFAPRSCRAVALPVTFRYDTQYDASDFSRTMRLTLLPEAAPTRVLFAAYYNGTWSHFSGIEVPRGFETCLASVSSSPSWAIRHAHGVTLPPAWERATLYQTLADFSHRFRDRRSSRVVRFQKTRPSREPPSTARCLLPAPWTIRLRSRAVAPTEDGWCRAGRSSPSRR